MILGETNRHGTATAETPPVTLGDLFGRACVRRSDAIALIDPPNRAAVCGGEVRRLRYADADRIVTGIAERLRLIGMQTDTIVAVQLPNTVESILTVLGILRAGMIPAPLPLLWRKTDMIAALSRIGAKVLITAARIGDYDSAGAAMAAAAELFPVRFVCAFGKDLPDGIVPLEDLLTMSSNTAPPPVERAGNPADHVAMITWEVTAGGIVPVARSHAELIAGGMATTLEGRLGQNATILSATPISSFAGLAVTMMPWLLTGGTLALHHSFDPAVFAAQRDADGCDTAVVAGTLLPPLVETGFCTGMLRTMLALWRTPEWLGTNAPWTRNQVLVDVSAFGEIGLVALRRDAGALPDPIRGGRHVAPHSASYGGIPVIELARSDTGTLLMRGPMVPANHFPPGPEPKDLAHLGIAPDGFVDSGYGCKFDPVHGTLAITAPPAGLVSVGGYRFVRNDIDAMAAVLGPGIMLAALPSALTGHRLAGRASDPEIRQILVENGVNALISGAFRDRGGAEAA